MNKINYTSTYLTKHSRDFYRGQSIHYSGKWTIGSHYIYDNYEIDFVVHNNVLLACSKSHLANIDNKPTDFIYDERGTIIGINSDCWDFVLAGILGKEGKIYLPSYDKDTGLLTWHLISNDEAEEESIGGEIPMSLAGLKDDENHRVVTDVQISSWDQVVSDLSDFINEVTTKSTEYVKKINNPFAVGSGIQSAFQKNPEHPNTASGNSSVAIGADNEATKIGSFAANRKNHATGDDSNATGYGNTASGDTSHAEGHYTTASGKYSHTEGHGTTASNDGTHAEGWNSKATGDTSHAEGHGTVAGGPRSHTEGKFTKTTNDSEHAQGIYNKSNTGTIHSIGIGTSDTNRKNAVEVLKNGNVYITGIGNYDGTNPLNDNSLQSLVSTFITKSVNDLVNYFTKTEVTNLINSISQFHYEVYHNIHLIQNPQSNVLYLVGPKLIPGEPLSDKYEEYVYSNNDLIKIGDTSIDLSGYVTTDALNAALANYTPSASMPFESGTGTNSAQLKSSSSIASGKNAVAVGNGTTASGNNSVSEGHSTVASGAASHAEGKETIASGQRSHAEGELTLAGQKAYRYDGFSQQSNNGLRFVNEPVGFAVGDVVSIINDTKYADCATITDIYLDDFENWTVEFDKELPFTSIVSDTDFDKRLIYVSAKPDVGDIDLGRFAHAEGWGSKAQNVAAHAEGRDTKAYGEYSHAEGRNTLAQYAAHAEGKDTQALGERSHAEGHQSMASGGNAHAEGSTTTASGDNSHAEGASSVAGGDNSHAEGSETVTQNVAEHAEGKYNKSNKASDTFGDSGNTLHSVGIGDAEHLRKNAIEIMQNGDAYLFGLGGYDGTNPDTASTLKQVIDAKGTYNKPSTGIPASDLAAGIIPEIEAFTTEELDTIWLNSV